VIFSLLLSLSFSLSLLVFDLFIDLILLVRKLRDSGDCEGLEGLCDQENVALFIKNDIL
jgi:hypothetical protein